MIENWRLIELGAPEAPDWNMALDTALLEMSVGALPVVRFYRWDREAVSIGYFQSVEKTACAERAAGRAGTAVVRRPTGGGLVRHGADLTLSLSVPESHSRFDCSTSQSYRLVHAVILTALEPIFPGLAFSSCAAPLTARGRGDRVCFEEPVSCDIEWKGRKVVGSSQRRKNGRLLHQTSVQLPGDAADMARRVVRALETEWAVGFRFGTVTSDEKQSAASVRSRVYGSPEWAHLP